MIDEQRAKRFGWDVIGGYVLWSVLYGIIAYVAVFACTLLFKLIQLPELAFSIVQLVATYIIIFFMMKGALKDAVKSAAKRGCVHQSDVEKPCKMVTTYIIITLVIGIILSLVSTVLDIVEINKTVEAVEAYGSEEIIQIAKTAAKEKKIGVYVGTAIGLVATILMNIHYIKYVRRKIEMAAVPDDKPVSKPQKRISLFVVSIIISGVIVVSVAIIAAIITLSSLGTGAMQNSMNNFGNMINSLEPDGNLGNDENINGGENTEKDPVTPPAGDEGNNNQDEEQGTEKPVVKPTIGSKLDSSKDWVYTQYSNDNNGKYKLPKINMYSSGVEKINNEIKTNIISKAKNGIEVGEPWSASYNWYVNNNILSLVINMNYSGDVKAYYVYNVNMKTGAICTNSELLSLKGLSESDFLNKAKIAYSKTFKEKYNTISSNDKQYIELYNKTISSSNYSVNVPMFLNSNGELVVVGNIYSFAGAESYKHLITVTGVAGEYIIDATYPYNVSQTSYTTEFNETYSVKDIVVPYINIDSADARKANEEIKTFAFDSAISTYKAGLKDKITYTKVGYKYTLKNDMLYVLVTRTTGGTDIPSAEYYTYCFNTKTGKSLTYVDVYKAAGFTSDNIDVNVSVAISKVVKEKLKDCTPSDYAEGENETTYINSAIISYQELKQYGTLDYYLDSNGKLNIVVELQLPAGGNNEALVVVEKNNYKSALPLLGNTDFSYGFVFYEKLRKSHRPIGYGICGPYG